MNFVYDIFLNFNKKFYEFFDWNHSDNFLHIKKIPIFRIDNDTYFNLKNDDIIFDNSFLHKIYKKTDFFKKNNEKFDFSFCLITNDLEIIGLKINKKGNIIAKSSLVIDEELEILNYVNKMNIFNINYDVICKKNEKFFITRHEEYMKKKFLNFLSFINKNKKYDLVNYLYFECFNKYEDNFMKTFSKLKNSLNYDFFSVCDVFNNYFEISGLKNKKVFNFD